MWRVNDQVAVKKPVRKRLWKQLVQAKIRGQAGNLADGSPARKKLPALAVDDERSARPPTAAAY